jgi:ubiquinone/menaquinone biosynthesis C-methylase UbiE
MEGAFWRERLGSPPVDRAQRERIVEAYQGWAASYDQLMRRTYHRVERAISRVHLGEHLPPRPEGRLLDAGGGDATWCATLLEGGRAGRATLIDISPDMIELARRKASRKRLPVEPVLGDVEALPFPDASFDVTLALGGVVSHATDHERAVSELRRVTRSGGHLALSEDSRAVAIRTAREAKDPELLRAVLETGTAEVFHHHPFPFAVHFFTPGEIRELLEASSIDVLSVIGKPVFTRFLKPKEVLSELHVAARVEQEMRFVRDPGLTAFADQIEVIGRVR